MPAIVTKALRRSAPALLLAALTSLAEGFLIYSIFVGIYASILLYFVFLVSLLLIQAALDRLARTVVPALSRNTP